jgi:hypothetical protein
MPSWDTLHSAVNNAAKVNHAVNSAGGQHVRPYYKAVGEMETGTGNNATQGFSELRSEMGGGLSLLPGCQMGYTEHTGCHQQPMHLPARPTRVAATPGGCQVGLHEDHTSIHTSNGFYCKKNYCCKNDENRPYAWIP